MPWKVTATARKPEPNENIGVDVSYDELFGPDQTEFDTEAEAEAARERFQEFADNCDWGEPAVITYYVEETQ